MAPELVLRAGYFLPVLLLSMWLDASDHLVAVAALPPVSFSFNFSNPSNTYRLDDLIFDGEATHPQNGMVNLTCDWALCGTSGRMSYAHPVQLYHNTTGGRDEEVASFSTTFTFVITNTSTTACRGDGMAFFVAGYPPNKIPPKSGGGYLGLISSEMTTASASERFIAVEFDTVNNGAAFDTIATDHIGIDVNSVKSVNSTSLPTNVTLDGTMTAYIAFNSSTRMLVASLWLHDDQPSTTHVQVSWQLDDPKNLLPPQVAVGFSASTGACKEVNQILSWSFNSTLALQDTGKHHNLWLLGGLVAGVLMVLGLATWFLFSYHNQKRIRNTFDMGTGGARRFDYHDLVAATDNFSNNGKLGQGAFGAVYSGFLARLGREVAVKKILRHSNTGHKDFFTEVKTISEARHKNLVKFLGWCCRAHSWNILHLMCSCFWKKKKEELFLVYELVNNGNLNDHLHNKKAATILSWPLRYSIAKDIGSALLYLHHNCYPYILHRDIKPANILIDKEFNAKLADFGLSRVANEDNVTLRTAAIGTEGYIDPQCRRDGNVRFNRSSDVYSFGIVLLEIVCIDKNYREQIWSLYERGGNVMDAADARLLDAANDDNKREIERVIILGLWCSSFEMEHRPSMRQVMDVLERDVPLPDLISIESVSAEQDASTDSVGNN